MPVSTFLHHSSLNFRGLFIDVAQSPLTRTLFRVFLTGQLDLVNIHTTFRTLAFPMSKFPYRDSIESNYIYLAVRNFTSEDRGTEWVSVGFLYQCAVGI